MIGEDTQDQATLYALGLLDEAEAAEFERLLAADAELRAFTGGLTEAVSAVALATKQHAPPPELREKILGQFGAPKLAVLADPPRPQHSTWVPWAFAAALAILCGVLGGMLAAQRANARHAVLAVKAPEESFLERLDIYSLKPQPGTPPTARAEVAWDRTRREGVLSVSGFAAPPAGKDYELWVVAEGQPQPISAGIFQVDGGGVARVRFKPAQAVTTDAKLFAVSVERAGGSPQKEGPDHSGGRHLNARRTGASMSHLFIYGTTVAPG